MMFVTNYGTMLAMNYGTMDNSSSGKIEDAEDDTGQNEAVAISRNGHFLQKKKGGKDRSGSFSDYDLFSGPKILKF